MTEVIETPILFLVFNRPEKTKQVFNVIKSAKPLKLYIAADAPRKHVQSDEINCNLVRKIVSEIDWNCEVKLLFQEKNLGCSLAGKTAWDWIFTFEEEMIFIEDDGLISKSFFWYCQELLEKYRYDNRIAYVGGVNFGLKFGNSSYFFSRPTVSTYSMATWKRVHQLYEYKLNSYNEIKNSPKFKTSFSNYFMYVYYKKKFEYYLKHGGNTYDLQMVFLVYKYNMYCIYPNINMTSNIGLDYGGANNNVCPKSKFAQKYGNRPRFEIKKIIHPEKFEINNKFEKKHIKLRIFYNKPWFYTIAHFYLSPFLGPIYRKSIKLIIKKIKNE